MSAYDFHIRLPPQPEMAEVQLLQKVAATLGFAGLAIETSKALTNGTVHEKLTIFRRVTLVPRSTARLRAQVNKQTKDADLLVIHGRSKPIWLVAAEIPAVHMVMAKEIEDFMVIDSQTARAMANQNKPVEICLHKLLVLKGAIRSRLMRVMNSAMDHLGRADCPLILTSGASGAYELRSPQDLMALSYLASVPENLAKTAMRQESKALVSAIRHSTSAHPVGQIGREK
ncbi:MAG: RNase P subunit p30 family protein [Promethearchaeota archaeon]